MNLENLPVLSKLETNELLKKVKNGDTSSRDKLIECNLRFCMLFAQKYAKNNFEVDEYFSDAVLGLTKAIDAFKEDKIGKISFLTFAGICIKNEILLTIRKKNKKSNDYVSLQDIISPLYEDDKPSCLEDVIPSNDSSLITQIIIEDNYEKLYSAIQKLPEREQYILKRKYGITSIDDLKKMDKYSDNYGNKYHCVSDSAIADELNISRPYVTKIHNQALHELKKELKNIENQINN